MTDLRHAGDTVVWRPTITMRSFVIAAAVVGFAFSVATMVTVFVTEDADDPRWLGASLAIGVTCLSAYFLSYACNARIELRPEHLLVVTAFRREHRFAWRRILHASADGLGIWLVLDDGKRFVAGAVQTGPPWPRSQRPRRADHLVEQILTRAEAAGAQTVRIRQGT